jgi:hypothetical protein
MKTSNIFSADKAKTIVSSIWIIILAAFSAFAASDHQSAIISASKDQIKAFFNTDKVKFVFEENAGVYFVDFSQEPLTVRKMSGITHKVIAPCVSEDGKWITYASNDDTHLEDDLTNNSSVKSSAYICRIDPAAAPAKIISDYAHVPRFVKCSGQLDIMYATIGIWDAWNKKEGSVKRQNILPDGAISGQEQIVYNDFAMYGGLSCKSLDGKQYLATAIGSTGGAWMVELPAAGAPVQLHILSTRESNTSSTYSNITPQVCNPSVSSSRLYPGAMMYLDFGSSNRYHDFINKSEAPWNVHQIIMIGDYSGKIVRYFNLPSDITRITVSKAGELKNSGIEGGAIIETASNTYEFPEWSTHPCFGVSCVQTDRLWWKDGSYKGDPSSDTEMRLRNEYIYGINLNTGNNIRLIHTSDTLYGRTTNFRWAGLWVDTATSDKEEAGWLGRTAIRKGNSSEKPLQGRRMAISLDGNLLTSEEGIIRIDLYNMAGSLIEAFSSSNTSLNSINIRDIFNVNSCVYFVRVTAITGNSRVLRWVVPASQKHAR